MNKNDIRDAVLATLRDGMKTEQQIIRVVSSPTRASFTVAVATQAQIRQVLHELAMEHRIFLHDSDPRTWMITSKGQKAN
jgi:hypothetical protein